MAKKKPVTDTMRADLNRAANKPRKCQYCGKPITGQGTLGGGTAAVGGAGGAGGGGGG